MCSFMVDFLERHGSHLKIPLVTQNAAATSSHNLFVTSLRLKLTSYSLHTERREKNVRN
jgi:hypothetical protein